jgi:hypothetical protein
MSKATGRLLTVATGSMPPEGKGFFFPLAGNQGRGDCMRPPTVRDDRQDDPAQRRLGLPISNSSVESVVKPMNRHRKRTEPFGKKGGAKALWQTGAASVSEDGRAERYGSRPRPHSRADRTGRLSP